MQILHGQLTYRVPISSFASRLQIYNFVCIFHSFQLNDIRDRPFLLVHFKHLSSPISHLQNWLQMRLVDLLIAFSYEIEINAISATLLALLLFEILGKAV